MTNSVCMYLTISRARSAVRAVRAVTNGRRDSKQRDSITVINKLLLRKLLQSIENDNNGK